MAIRSPSTGVAPARSRRLADADPPLNEPICAHNPETLAQAVYAIEHEHAATLADVLLRRLPVGWSACHALDGLERLADAFAARFSWAPEQAAREVSAYETELRETLVPVSDIEP